MGAASRRDSVEHRQWERMRDALATFCESQNARFLSQLWLDYVEVWPEWGQGVNCLNCGQLERLHGDPNLPAGDQLVCGEFESNHETVTERLERYADLARERGKYDDVGRPR